MIGMGMPSKYKSIERMVCLQINEVLVFTGHAADRHKWQKSSQRMHRSTAR